MSTKETADLVDETGRNSLDPKHAPQSLPAASFDVEALNKGFNAAVRGAEAKRDDAFAAAIVEAAIDKSQLEAVDPAAQPGYELVDVKHDELDITEQARVYKPGEEAESAATDAPVKE
jgi:hypothetical protein